MRAASPITLLAGALAALAPSPARADAATDWNRTALSLVASRAVSPPVASRALAIVSIAMSDAANAVDRRYAGYEYTGDAPNADPRAAVGRAACDALKALFPNDAPALQATLDARLAGIGAGRAAGESAGANAAFAVFMRRTADGSGANALAYTGSNVPGHWRPTPGAYAPGLLPRWGEVTPFTLTSGSQFRPGPMPALNSPEYARDLAEVRSLGAQNSTTRTAAQGAIAAFWAAGTGTVTPPGMWNEIANGAIERRASGLAESAHALALLNTTLADAAIAVWDAKYAYDGWRPVSALRADGDPADANWNSYLTTPNFPGYVSGHSTFSAAAAGVLTGLYGDEPGGFDVLSAGTAIGGTGVGAGTRHFLTYADAAAEAGRSRVYGGIHFEFDNQAGLTLGSRIAANALRSPNAQPVPEPATLATLALGAAALLRRRRS